MSARSTVAFLDVSAGVAGDMCLGALVDAGLPLSALEDVVAALGLSGVTLRARRVQRGAFAATKVDVVLPGGAREGPGGTVHGDHGHDHGHARGAAHRHAHPAVHGPDHPHGAGEDHEHRTLDDVLGILRGAKGLPPEAMADAVRAFTLLAEAEGKVHGIPPGEVRFHEVGALDAIVDVVGTCVGLRRLGVLEVRASAAPWPSTGTVEGAHGRIPLPAPATVLLLAGHPTFPSGETFEQVTPTGAALVKALSRGTEPPVGFVPRVVGCGAGDLDAGRLPNVVRLVVGEASDGPAPDAVLLETNLDDATGQQVGHAIDAALAAGALDAWATPAVMKKGRPGVVLSVLSAPPDAPALEALLFRETPTLGVRRRAVSRTLLPRRVVEVATPYGAVHVKVRTTPAGDEATPEYEDCRAAAARHGVSLPAVQAAAAASWAALSRPGR